jgi:hypothetical protein
MAGKNGLIKGYTVVLRYVYVLTSAMCRTLFHCSIYAELSEETFCDLLSDIIQIYNTARRFFLPHGASTLLSSQS